ncbi:MAG: XRE family transcriptional regulator, partial [Clostridia bacterium]|nr:XRE family transcriptional regulator [Clostridia bacterium]
IGITVLLLIVAAAVAIFIYFGSRLSKYDYMEKEAVKPEPDARDMIMAEQEAMRAEYTKRNIIGTVLCILGAISTLAGAFTENEMLVMVGISGTLLLVAFGVYSFVTAGVPWGAMQKMLEEGDFTRSAKSAEKIMEPISAVYWLVVTAGYLGYSFITSNWHISWVVWPVAGILFGVVSAIVSAVVKLHK